MTDERERTPAEYAAAWAAAPDAVKEYVRAALQRLMVDLDREAAQDEFSGAVTAVKMAQFGSAMEKMAGDKLTGMTAGMTSMASQLTAESPKRALREYVAVAVEVLELVASAQLKIRDPNQ